MELGFGLLLHVCLHALAAGMLPSMPLRLKYPMFVKKEKGQKKLT